MKKKNMVFIIIYVIILAIPAFSMPFFFNAKNTENRTLATFPEFVTEEGVNKEFIGEFDDFINDRIGFRSILVSMNTKLRTTLFKVSTEDSIILGKNGWLYYSDTASDYMKIPTISERNIKNIANTIEMVDEKLSKDGVSFTFTVIPNKNSLYGENMPGTYIVTNGQSNRELLEEALKNKNVDYLSMYEVLDSYNNILYQAQDSHWTYEGGLYGYRALMDLSGMEYKDYSDLTFKEAKDWDSDLATMLYSVNAKKGVQAYPDYEFNYEYTSHEKEVDSITLKTESQNGKGKAVIYRDSFMNTAHVYFAENFEKCVFSRAVPYKIDLVSKEEADYVLIEIVERNIKNLAVQAPIMEALEMSQEDIINATYVNPKDYSVFVENENNYTHIYGYIDESYLKDDNEIYIEAMGVTYQAFPIYEQTKLGSEEIKDNGFSLYIPETEEKFSIEVYVNN